MNKTFIAGLAGALVVLAVLGAFLALDRTTLHLYSADDAPSPPASAPQSHASPRPKAAGGGSPTPRSSATVPTSVLEGPTVAAGSVAEQRAGSGLERPREAEPTSPPQAASTNTSRPHLGTPTRIPALTPTPTPAMRLVPPWPEPFGLRVAYLPFLFLGNPEYTCRFDENPPRCGASGEADYFCSIIGDDVHCYKVPSTPPEYWCSTVGAEVHCRTFDFGYPDFICSLLADQLHCWTSQGSGWSEYWCSIAGDTADCYPSLSSFPSFSWGSS